MKKFLFIVLMLSAVLAVGGCKRETEKTDLPENIISYENKTNAELVPANGVEEHGTVVEAEPDPIPSEDELGEYEEVFMGGDILEDGSVAGWVLAISLKDITVNTYNKITTYALEGDAKGCTENVKPGDAVLISFRENDDGTKSAYDVGRVRVEDGARTKEEIEAMQKGK